MKRIIIGILAFGLTCGPIWAGPKGGGGGGNHAEEKGRGREKNQETVRGKPAKAAIPGRPEEKGKGGGGRTVYEERQVYREERVVEQRGSGPAARSVVREPARVESRVVTQGSGFQRVQPRASAYAVTENRTTINRTVINETVVNRRSVASRYYDTDDRFDSRYYAPRARGSSLSLSLGIGVVDGDTSVGFGLSYSRGGYCPPPPVVVRRRPVVVVPPPSPVVVVQQPAVVVVEPEPVVVVQPQPVVVIEPEPVVVVPLHRRWYRPEPTVVIAGAVNVVRPAPVVVASSCAVYSPLYTPTPVVVVPQAASVVVAEPAPVVVPAPRYDYGRGTSVDVNFHYEKRN